jgi:protein-L-isoaspartate(D-aspartate) O-methyltransferase
MAPGDVAPSAGRAEPEAFAAERARMVEEQVRARGVRDPRVLAAMREVPRHSFVPRELWTEAYGDWPLPTAWGQTISQPYIVGRMLELAELEAGQRVLEVGTGSGYQTALLRRLAGEVYSIERIHALLEVARERLTAQGATDVRLLEGDGTLGWRDFAPYDRVLVAAAAPRVPEALKEQLGDGGVLVIPVGGAALQRLEVWRRTPAGGWQCSRHGECRFVPLLGRDAWQAERDPSRGL